MSRSRRLLLVDDNPDDVALTLRAFEKLAIVSDIVVAKDGREALDYLFASGAHAGRDTRVMPDAVLLDLNMPEIDGLDVLRRIRDDARTRFMPVVILTSSREAEDVARSYQLGANSYVRKPVDFSEFVAAAQQLGTYWFRLNEIPDGLAGR